MGSSESTRRVTVERDGEEENAGVVRVSERVVRRLQGKKDLPLNKNEDLTSEDINKLWRELQSEKAHLDSQKHKLEGLLQKAFEEGRGTMLHHEDSVNTEELEQMREDFKNRENQLITEIESLKKQNVNIDLLSQEQFNAAIDEVEGKFSESLRPAVCPNLKQQVIDCYRQHPQQTLNCARFVKEFEMCVQRSRLDSLQDIKS